MKARGLATISILFLSGALAQAGEPSLATAEVAERTVSSLAVYEGRVEAVDQATVSAQTSGRVVEIPYDVDDFVPAGAVIVRLRDSEQRARMAQAEAALREAQARYEEARTEHERFKDLVERKLVSKSDFDRVAAAFAAARARLEAARAGREQAAEQLGYAEIRAPYAGIVTARHVEVGESVVPGQKLMSGLSLDRLRVVTAIPQRDIHAVREHNKAWVLVRRNGDERRIEATRLTIFPYADETSHAFRARIELDAKGAEFFPGMSVKAAFAIGDDRSLAVPSEAVFHRGEMAAVYVVGADGRPVLRQVRTGRRAEDGQIEILAGLTAGEQVALDPVQATLSLKKARGDE